MLERYGVTGPFNEHETLAPPPELFPKRPAYVVRQEGADRRVDVMTWGFPTTVKGAGGKPILKSVTNVRNYSSPFWRAALKAPERRCLVPFSTFCEWAGQKGAMVEHWFSLPHEPIASFAGIWRPTETGRVFAFLTCGYLGEPAAHIVGRVHPKATPVVLDRADEERWLTAPVEEALELACPFPSQMMTVVS